jgi:hypothetical protein
MAAERAGEFAGTQACKCYLFGSCLRPYLLAYRPIWLLKIVKNNGF